MQASKQAVFITLNASTYLSIKIIKIHTNEYKKIPTKEKQEAQLPPR